jgi:hydrophobic/amphiphilic exporter-1 (mainly G- bacteria), HAE1 family
MSITQIAIKRSTLVVIVFSILVGLGMICYTLLNYNLFPKMSAPVVTVSVTYTGASADEVESSVTKKLEDALSSLEDVDYMSSSSQEGACSITLTLLSNADADKALENAQRKVNQTISSLPDGIKTPSLTKFSSDDMPIIKLGVRAKISDTKLYQLIKDQIKSQISKIEGVGQVNIIGGNEREIKINVSRDKLSAYKISISQIYNAVNNANLEAPTGKIEGSLKQYTVRLSGKVKSIDELKETVISKDASGSIIKLSDLAEIIDGTAEQSSITRVNGDNSIGLSILKQSDANSVKVCQLVKKEISNIEKTYAENELKFNVVSDDSDYTLASANAVMEDLAIAIILVAIIMFLFLHSFRNSFIVLISIPTSIISVFIAMYILNFSLNMLTLMALSLVIGILVDDSIVVLENITRHLQMGKDKVQAAIDGRSEIGFTAVAITMVDVVVFLPLSLIMGMIGNMLREFSLVVVFSTLMSLIVSFTITPLLASRLGKIGKLSNKSLFGKLGNGFEKNYNLLVAFYERVLRWGLRHRKIVFITATILIVSSLSLIGFGFVGTEFINNGDRGEFVIKLEGESQNSLYQSNLIVQKVEDILYQHPEITKIYSNIGYSSSGMMSSSSNEQYKSEITVTLIDKTKRKISVDDYSLMIKKEILEKVAGVKVTSVPVTMTGGTSDAAIQVLLRGPEINKLYEISDSVKNLIASVPGTSDIKLSVDKSKPEIHIQIDREKMSMLGFTISDVSNILNLAFAGNTNLQYSDNGDDYDINVQFDKFDRKNIDDIGSLSFKNSKGDVVELKQFANITQSLGASKLERYNRMSSLTVQASVFGRPSGTVGTEIQEVLNKKLNLPQGVSISFKGQTERQNEAFSSLFEAIAAAIVLVYCVMVALYNSYLYPFVVLFSIPAAIIGALLALALSGENLSIFSLIGMIMLIGLVAKNAILLVDFTNHLKEKGVSVVEALVEAGKERLRPILMTTVAMVFGMLPLAISKGSGAESKNGLAWVIIGGLISSLLLTLVLVPSVYMTMENYKVKVKNLFRKRKPVLETEIVKN